MREIIFSMPDQILDTIKLMEKINIERKRYNKVLICGMGGSGMSGEILQGLFPGLQIILNRNYSIPEYIDKKTLGILISYSGNTEETLHNHKLLTRKKTGIVIISSNGRLLNKRGDVKIKIPKGLPPRGALGYLFTPLPFVLHEIGLTNYDPKQKLTALVRFLHANRDKIEIKAKRLAKKFSWKLPIIYANTQMFLSVARRWQCQLNENSKVLAHINIIPEMNHNEIVGLGRPDVLNKKIVLTFLMDPDAFLRNKARVKIIEKIIKDKFQNLIEIHPDGKNNLQRIFWTIMLGDFISYYVAVNTNIDPMPVKRIDYLKKQLSKL